MSEIAINCANTFLKLRDASSAPYYVVYVRPDPDSGIQPLTISAREIDNNKSMKQMTNLVECMLKVRKPTISTESEVMGLERQES